MIEHNEAASTAGAVDVAMIDDTLSKSIKIVYVICVSPGGSNDRD